jgi:hypothetical protein
VGYSVVLLGAALLLAGVAVVGDSTAILLVFPLLLLVLDALSATSAQN